MKAMKMIVGFGFIFACLAAVVGWVLNVYQVFMMVLASSPVTTLFIAKFVGIFAFPLGAVLGWV